MTIEKILGQQTVLTIQKLYSSEVKEDEIVVSPTKKEFEGDFTVTCFPFTKFSKKSPDTTANEIGTELKSKLPEIEKINVIKGFLNIVISDSYWISFLSYFTSHISPLTSSGQTVMIEYSSPNTNKPLHLGHIRNNVLGYSVAEILKANGYNVIKVNLVNDRGIHICKSMLAWLKWGNGETPQSGDIKGDHLIGKYYVIFDKENKKQAKIILEKWREGNIENIEGVTEKHVWGIISQNPVQEKDALEKAEGCTPLMKQAQELLRKWEAGDKETIDLWKKMNDWVYEGFEQTYKKMGVDFDKIYYESQTYLLGKDIVKAGLEKNVFYKKPDGSVWVKLDEYNLEEKCLLRADGTSIYITQDIGTAVSRFEEFKLNKLLYVVGNEQDHHFKVLFSVLDKLIKNNVVSISHFTSHISHLFYHLSYGMVDLPSGKMKSREGTVVDADNLMDEMVETARKTTQELGKIEGFTDEEAHQLYHTIGIGALKYFLLKVDPKKRLLFNPQESIDFHGHTGPFIQYTYARIKSILRKAEEKVSGFRFQVSGLKTQEKELIISIYQYPSVVREAGEKYDPSHIANYVYNLAKTYNKFYADLSVLSAESENLRNFRLKLSEITAATIQSAMKLLGITVPERM